MALDQRERVNDLEEALRAMLEGALAESWHALPGIVRSYNAGKISVEVQASVMINVRQPDGSLKSHDWSSTPFLDVPVLFPGGGNFIVTFPLQPGDEVLVIFADRCIDNWWQSGGVQPEWEVRFHSLSDGFAIPGPRSLPNVPPSVSTTTCQIRTLDGTSFIELAPGGVVNIKAPGGLNLNGAMVATGEITAKSTHTVTAHTHSDPQGGSTGTPTG